MKALYMSSKYSTINDAFDSLNYVHTGPSIPADAWMRIHPGLLNHVLSAGRGVVAVVMHDGTYVLVGAPDFDLLRRRGWLGRWSRQGRNQPRIQHGRKSWSLARLIVGANSGVRVSYRNGNPADLTRRNLILKRDGINLAATGGTCPWAPMLSSADAVRMFADANPAVDEAIVDHHIATGLSAVLAATSALLRQLVPQDMGAVRHCKQA